MSILFVFGLYFAPWTQLAYSVHSSTVLTDTQCKEQRIETLASLRKAKWDTLIVECREL